MLQVSQLVVLFCLYFILQVEREIGDCGLLLGGLCLLLALHLHGLKEAVLFSQLHFLVDVIQ